MIEPLLDTTERARVIGGPFGSDATYGPNGHFIMDCPVNETRLFIVASNGGGWEHVSVHPFTKKRCPTWEEMSWVKDQFWGPDEAVYQYHPPKELHINLHPYTLHLWRPIGQEIPMPPTWMVGPKQRQRH